MTVPARPAEAGFSLVEMLVAMTVMLVVLAGTSRIMSMAMDSRTATTQVLDMNGHLRAAMDLIERDLLQSAQGLPVGRRVGVPNGASVQRIRRPGPAASGSCAGVADFPDLATLPAVSVGPDLGPPVNGQCSDIITALAGDNLFSLVPTAAIASDGSSVTIHSSANISDSPDAQSDNLHPGDVLMLTKGDLSVLVQVTAVAGQVVTLGTGTADPLRLNQRNTNLAVSGVAGTINLFKATAPVDPDAPAVVGGVQQRGASLATRVRMVTYFVDASGAVPRLMRQVGGAAPNVVAVGVDAFRVTYDLATSTGRWRVNVRMNAADVGGTGACVEPGRATEVNFCSENQIRKANLVLSLRAFAPEMSQLLLHGNQSRTTLYAQVSLRNMAFVDRY